MTIFRNIFLFFNEIFIKRHVIVQLVRSDFRNRYIGSFLGFLWALIQPMAMTFIFWFVFSRMWGAMQGPGGEPFLSYFITGFVAWNFFLESMLTSTLVFAEYSFLVKKVSFEISILPLVKILSSFLFHCIFLVLAAILVLIKGASFSFYWIQLIYYIFALSCLIMGISWLTSSLQVFIKDIAQMVNVALQFGFWLTPIVWNITMIQEPKIMIFLKLNPLLYIVDGYRKSMLYKEPFWADINGMAYFWSVTIIIMLIATLVFRKLKPHFADVI